MVKAIFLSIIFVLVAGFVVGWWGEGEIEAPAHTHAMISVASPAIGSKVKSPLLVTGEARGNWFFEASFPVKLLDGNGLLIATAIAQAEGEWMTTEFVPFRATLEFVSPTTEIGTILLEKNNPSGLPEHDDFFSWPIRFAE